MTTRVSKPHCADIRARLALFHGTSVTAKQALALCEDDITFEMLLQSGCKTVNVVTASISFLHLKAMGADTPHKLRQLGFNALHLCDPDVCNQASMAYGAVAVTDAFLTSAQDAVALAGTEAMHILNITNVQLFAQCAGFPGEAKAVLQQLAAGTALRAVSARVLLDAGIRSDALKQCGYGITTVVDQLAPTSAELVKLGFV